MAKFKLKKRKVGAIPGSIIYTGQRKTDTVTIHYAEYNEEKLVEETLDNRTLTEFHEPVEDLVQWYDLRGIHDTKLIGEFGKVFNMHPLVMEDIADVEQRPKFEEHDGGNFITFRALTFDKVAMRLVTENIALYFGKGFLLSFQERETDLFAKVRKRIQKSAGRIRKKGSDYLAYALVDFIADHYFTVLDEIEVFLAKLELEIETQPRPNIKTNIHRLRRELIKMRKSVAPLRECVSKMLRSESELIDEGTTVFIQDLYDHTIQITDMVESYRDSLNGLQDLYMSEVSFKMNQVMQVLTVVTTVFIPLSFLTGLYGMNFDNIPELHSEYGYFVLLTVMSVITVGLLLFFKQRKWM